ncbi:MAG: hypothetical protein H7X97_09415 [Opitutaceae bacterium]|nr:hypothetical protein [Verrucomicrobiales bacterium]
MTLRALILASLVVNLAMAVATWRLWPRPSSRGSGVLAERTVVFNNGPLRTSSNGLRIDITITNSPPQFRWQTIARDSYTNYIASLRAVGCPEQTIRDLITAELTEENNRQRRALLAPLQADYWSHAMRGLAEALNDYEEKIDLIDARTTDQIDILLPQAKQGPVHFSVNGAQTGHLPVEKKDAVKALHERFSLAAAKFMDDPGVTKEEKDRQKKLLQQQLDGELKQLVTPEDYAEMQLRGSRHAEALRGMIGLDLSPEEMRKLVLVLERYEKSPGGSKPGQPGAEQKKAQEQELRDVLGDRYESYVRAQDSNYGQAYRIARRFDLPPETATQVDDVRKSVGEAAQALGKNSQLTRDQRREALLAVQREAESTVREILGEKASDAYQRVGGDWIRSLSASEPQP